MAPTLPQAPSPVLKEPCNFAPEADKFAGNFTANRFRTRRSLGGAEMFQFEGYTLDVARHSLRAADREVALRRKSFELLRYLVENPDRLVTKEELLKAIWPNVVVADEALTRCVSDVRQAIGDSEQAIIATVPRCGYRFTAPVVRVAANAAAVAPSPLVEAGRGGGSGGGGNVVPLATPTPDPSLQGGGEQARVGASLDRPAVAVLPFANLSGDPQQDYFSDGIAEDITTELSRFSELLVIARNSTFQYKGKAVDIRQAAQELGARYVVEGSVRRSGDRIRIAAQLIDAVAGAHRWGERYDRELRDAFAVQDEVARTIVSILVGHVKRAEIERALLKPPAVWEAYEYYLRGAEAFFLLMSRGTKASLHEARRLLEQSLAIDPDYARAAATLSETLFYSYIEPIDGDYLNPAALDRVLELAETAVRLDARLPQARAQLGHVLIFKRQLRRPCTRPDLWAWPITCSNATARRCVGSANVHCACRMSSCPIFGSHPPMPSWDDLRRPGKRQRRCCGSTPGSQLKDTNVFSSSKTPRMSSIELTGCARRGCRRVEHCPPYAPSPRLSVSLPGSTGNPLNRYELAAGAHL